MNNDAEGLTTSTTTTTTDELILSGSIVGATTTNNKDGDDGALVTPKQEDKKESVIAAAVSLEGGEEVVCSGSNELGQEPVPTSSRYGNNANNRHNTNRRRTNNNHHTNKRATTKSTNCHGGKHNSHNNSDDKSRRVYVGNLSWEVTWRELKEHVTLNGFDNVSRVDVLTTSEGRSKGCGIVEFASSDDAERAVLELNDTDFMGRQIFVREDRENTTPSIAIPTTSTTHNINTSSINNSATTATASVVVLSDSHVVHTNAQSRRVYVGNLSWDVAWQDLKDHMRSTGGEVLYAEVMIGSDGRSKGCGIVEFLSAKSAQDAIQNLTDTELKGRMIFVREDREQSSGSGGGGGASISTSGGGPTATGTNGGGASDKQKKVGSCSVFVSNLAWQVGWRELKDYMRHAGNVDQANVLSGDEGHSKGCGIVNYQNPQDAARAIRELNNSIMYGRPIHVRENRGTTATTATAVAEDGGGACQLFVSNIPWDTQWYQLKDHFSQCGDVERVEVIEGADGRKKGFATVRFYKSKDAMEAISVLIGVDFMGRPLQIIIDNRSN